MTRRERRLAETEAQLRRAKAIAEQVRGLSEQLSAAVDQTLLRLNQDKEIAPDG